MVLTVGVNVNPIAMDPFDASGTFLHAMEPVLRVVESALKGFEGFVTLRAPAAVTVVAEVEDSEMLPKNHLYGNKLAVVNMHGDIFSYHAAFATSRTVRVFAVSFNVHAPTHLPPVRSGLAEFDSGAALCKIRELYSAAAS